MERDLTVGKPSKVLWMFCLPLFGSIIFQQLYNLADSIVAGKFIGKDALAAVSNGYEITLIFLAFAFGCNIGCSVIASRLYGEKRNNDVKTCIYTALISTIAICVILTILGLALTKPLLELINTPDDIIDDSALYLDIYIYGLIFVFIYNVSTGIFSSLGDSKTPFIFLAISSISNIGMDILFVAVFKMGIAGVAWATFICQAISAVLAFIIVFIRIERLPINTNEKRKVFSFGLLKEMAIIAIPSTLQQSFISIGNIFIQSVINSFGSDAIAGYGAAVKLNNLMITSLTTVGNGISNYTAQNLGAGKIKRIHEGFLAGIKMVLILCIPFIILYLTIGRYLLYIFMDDSSEEALNIGVMFLRIVSPFYLIVAVKLVADGILRGSSKMVFFMIATFTDLILRVALAFLLSQPFGTNGIWFAWPIGWTIATILSVSFYFVVMKKNKELA